MANNKDNTHSAQKVLAFDANYKLVAMFSSFYTASHVTGVCHQMIVKACSGETIAAKGYYWRELNDQYILDCDDLNNLTLIDYDSQLGVNRQIYANRSMRKNEIIFESQFNQRFTIIRQRQRESWQRKSKSKS